MFKSGKTSLILPAYNEEENIGEAIDDFSSLGIFDEIIVIDNNSQDKTYQIAHSKKAKVIKEQKQGYGFAIRRGLKEARGEYVVLCEPDHTFRASDVKRLLEHINTYTMVTGTRTHKKFIEKGANMHFLLRFGNILVAKVIQLAFSTNSLSDCGCTFRVLRRSQVQKILPFLTVGGSHFLSELVALTALSNGTIKEIPVCYRVRIGTSKITGSLKRSIIVAYNMIKTIIKYRISKKGLFNKSVT